MTKFLTYFFLFMLLAAGCGALFGDSTAYSPDSTVAVDTTFATDTTSLPFAEPPAPVVPQSGKNTKNTSPSYTSSDDINCDDAEELYDSGASDDIADYCDYGPDGEWDTNDDYDSWEE